jgi:zinc transporter ZupT
MSLANSYSAGIFLASGLVHLLPEAIHAWPSHPDAHHDSDHEHSHSSPKTPFLLCAIGFFIAFFVEKVIFLADEEHDSCGDNHDHDHTGLIKHVADGASLPPMAWLLTIVLSVHSLFGGMALGVSMACVDGVNVVLSRVPGCACVA